MFKTKFPLYLVSVLPFMLLLPAGAIAIELFNGELFGWLLVGKWFIFWALGVRLFIAGLRQTTMPGFTAKEVFHISGTDSFPVIGELGFANLCLGLI